jgi:propanol-preferring alcohol dehydrogenase
MVDHGGVRAMTLEKVGAPLVAAELPDPVPGPGELLLKVHVCAVCRTDLHIVDGEVAAPRLPLVPGHQIVATVLEVGPEASGGGSGSRRDRVQAGARVGVPWLGWADGVCRYCLSGRENLCERGRFTGLDIDGGYAELTVAHAAFCHSLPDGFSDVEVAPLLCAGLIGYRALRRAGDAERLGLYGFGASAHLIAQVAVFEGRRVFAFTRRGDTETQAFARELGAEWAGGSDEAPPEELDAAIIFAPVGPLVPAALRAVARGGTVVCAGIHMSDIPAFPYELLWGERTLGSVANLTRSDGREFMDLAPRVPVRAHHTEYPLSAANDALGDLRSGRLEGSAVLVVD